VSDYNTPREIGKQETPSIPAPISTSLSTFYRRGPAALGGPSNQSQSQFISDAYARSCAQPRRGSAVLGDSGRVLSATRALIPPTILVDGGQGVPGRLWTPLVIRQSGDDQPNTTFLSDSPETTTPGGVADATYEFTKQLELVRRSAMTRMARGNTPAADPPVPASGHTRAGRTPARAGKNTFDARSQGHPALQANRQPDLLRRLERGFARRPSNQTRCRRGRGPPRPFISPGRP